jgi:hypothetical protein
MGKILVDSNIAEVKDKLVFEKSKVSNKIKLTTNHLNIRMQCLPLLNTVDSSKFISLQYPIGNHYKISLQNDVMA